MPNCETARKSVILKKSVNKEGSSQGIKDAKQMPNLRLTGSQINLTKRPRSGNGKQNQGATGFRGKRPMSAIPAYGHKENYGHDIVTDSWLRPQSADIPYSGTRNSVSYAAENDMRKEINRNKQQMVKHRNKLPSKCYVHTKGNDTEIKEKKENMLFVDSKDAEMNNTFGETYVLPSSQLLDRLISEPLGRTWTECELKKCCEDLGMKHVFFEKCEIESITSETSDEICSTARSLGEQIIALARHPDHSENGNFLKSVLPSKPKTMDMEKHYKFGNKEKNENNKNDSDDLHINSELSPPRVHRSMNSIHESGFCSDMPLHSTLISHKFNSQTYIPTQSEHFSVLVTNDVSKELAQIKFQQWVFEKHEDKEKDSIKDFTSQNPQNLKTNLLTEHPIKPHKIDTSGISDILNFAYDSPKSGKEWRQPELSLECLIEEEAVDETEINNSISNKLNEDNVSMLLQTKLVAPENEQAVGSDSKQPLEAKENNTPNLKENTSMKDNVGTEPKEHHDKDTHAIFVKDNVDSIGVISYKQELAGHTSNEAEPSHKSVNLDLPSELVDHNKPEETKIKEIVSLSPDSEPSKSQSDSINEHETDKQKSYEKKSNVLPLPLLQDSEIKNKSDKTEVPSEVYRQILEILEDEEVEPAKNICAAKQLAPVQSCSISSSPKEKIQETIGEEQQTDSKLKDILIYLDEVERDIHSKSIPFQHDALIETANEKSCSMLPMPRLEELLKMGTVDLANQVLSLCLQVEEKTNSVNLLQEALNQQRELSLRSARNNERELKKRLKEQKEEYEAAIKRHQKFIDQLIADKKTLSSKCESLVMELKTNEERHALTLKAVEERHAIELQKAKEMHAAAEKLRRERWIDNKTNKIKEMTVKGLEPELQRMTTRHQQELADLRMIHKQELDELELRAARKTSQQLEQLREKLLAEKEEALAKERETLKQRLEKQMEEEERMYQEQRQKLLTEVRREKEHLADEEARMRQELEEAKQQMIREKNKIIQRKQQEHQEALDACIRRQQHELKTIKESFEIEKEAWIHNYKKQQEIMMSKKEIEIREQYKRERDREIEAAIDRLEKEATQMREELEQATDHRLRRLKEKYETEVQELESSESSLKMKLGEAKNKLVEKEDQIINLSAKGRQLEKELEEVKKIADRLSKERADIKEVIRKEFVNQMMDLQHEAIKLREEIAEIKARHSIELNRKNQEIETLMADSEHQLQKVYNRVKSTVTKKDDTIEKLKLQYASAMDRCSHLEQLLEQQRRDFLLE